MSFEDHRFYTSPVTEAPDVAADADRYPQDHELYGYVTPHGVQQAEGIWVVVDGKLVWNACGDDRSFAQESVDELMGQAPKLLEISQQKADEIVVSPSVATFANFGNVSGAAQNVMAVGIALQGPEFYEHVQGITGLTTNLGRLMLLEARRAAALGETGLIPALHTALKNERQAAIEATANGFSLEPGKSRIFVPTGEAPTGCARNELLGKVSFGTGNNDILREFGQQDVNRAFGFHYDTQAIADGHATQAELMGQEFSFGRRFYAATGLPVSAMYQDNHLPVEDTDVLINWNMNEAGAKGSHYTMDIVRTVFTVRQALREMNIALPIHDIMASFIITSTTTRDALAGSANDPRRLPLGFRGGSLGSAIEDIERQERNRF